MGVAAGRREIMLGGNLTDDLILWLYADDRLLVAAEAEGLQTDNPNCYP